MINTMPEKTTFMKKKNTEKKTNLVKTFFTRKKKKKKNTLRKKKLFFLTLPVTTDQLYTFNAIVDFFLFQPEHVRFYLLV